jgi:serine protease
MLDLDDLVAIDKSSVELLKIGGGAGGKESGGAGLDPKDRMDLLAQRLASARDPEFAHEIAKGAASALAKAGDPAARFNFREALGLEAVVQIYERPSLNIQDGFVNPAAAGYKPFEFKLLQMQDEIRAVISAVGRISLPDGTLVGTAIHIAQGRVVTARHVLEEIATQKKNGRWSFTAPGKTTIDFVGEAGGKSEPGFKIVNVKFCGADRINREIDFARLDLAVLEIAPITEAPWPGTVMFDGDEGKVKARSWVYTIGFPGRPKPWKTKLTPAPGYEVAAVIAKVFDDDFECKKFAPGRIRKSPGSLDDDKANRWVFAHDCSTLRGNSGSAVVEFATEGARVVGLHFGGLARSANWAHAFSALGDQMKAQGAKYA